MRDSLTQTIEDIYRNIDEQMRREREKPKKSPAGDRRLGPGAPPEGMKERRINGERRHNLRSPRTKDNDE
jgi:hypothetical protein